jgi:hypothetical protein
VSAGRPSHIIAPDEVDAWLADSAVRVVTYHNTDRSSADAILRDGVDVERSRFGSSGQGFYTTTVPDPFYGETSVMTAVRLHTPLVGPMDDVADLVDRLAQRFSPFDPRITPPIARQVRQELLAAGYDGVVAYDAGGDGIDYVVALISDAVRIVVAQ